MYQAQEGCKNNTIFFFLCFYLKNQENGEIKCPFFYAKIIIDGACPNIV